jgi:hypothetical protein
LETARACEGGLTVIVNAYCSALTPAIVFRTVSEIKRQTGRKPTKAITHPAQVASWASCAVLANAITFDPAEFPDLETQITMGGIPIEQRADVDRSHVVFVDENGGELGRIASLAIPIGFDR